MMAGNPNWWSMMINGMHPPQPSAGASPASQFVYSAPNLSSFPSSNSAPDHHHHHPSQDFPVRSLSQLLLGGLSGGTQERFMDSNSSNIDNLFHQKKLMENWEEESPHQALNLNPSHFMISRVIPPDNDHSVKQEFAHQFNNNYDNNNDQFQTSSNCNNWPSHVPAVSSPNSCTTTLSNSILNFSGKAMPPVPPQGKRQHHHSQDHSSECNSSSSGGASKKARVHQSSAQPALKVRKEKLGDRITALHQLVCPFGKTDTASVLSEAIGYIRFLQGHIEALSSPYMRSASGSDTVQHLHSGSEGPGVNDLRSRGLCLVPISCTQNVAGGDCGGADYWAPAAYGGASAF